MPGGQPLQAGQRVVNAAYADGRIVSATQPSTRCSARLRRA